MDELPCGRIHQRWAHLRFSIVGPLLAAPPARGELAAALEALSQKTWRHPITAEPVRFGQSTIERWLYRARRETVDPVSVLRRKVRKDLGRQSALSDPIQAVLRGQYQSHPAWSAQLHLDNLAALIHSDPQLGPMVSYSTVRRFLQANGLFKRRRLGPVGSPGAARAEARFADREVRSYEVSSVHGLWHLDFHHGSRKVLVPDGARVVPLLLGILDDRSRVCCHLQWYLTETARDLVHGFSQSVHKRGLPRGLLTDNGAAMVAGETRQGLARLGILHETTLPYSPYQNAKQEVFWAQVEGRLMAMLEGESELTLGLLNEATQAWVEMEYNRKIHSEIGQTPLSRMLEGPDVSRPSPSSDELRKAFMCEVARTQRRSDGTFSLAGVRFEIPSRYRHLQKLTVRYAEWDLASVFLVDERTGTLLCPLYPLDREANSDGQRRTRGPLAGSHAPDAQATPAGIAPLLKQLMAQYAATGLPPAYVPQTISDSPVEEADESSETL